MLPAVLPLPSAALLVSMASVVLALLPVVRGQASAVVPLPSAVLAPPSVVVALPSAVLAPPSSRSKAKRLSLVSTTTLTKPACSAAVGA